MTEDEMDCILDSMDMSLSKRPELMMDRKCCSPWGCKESDMTESPTWTEWQTWKLYLCVAATAKSLQSCLTLCDHIDSSPPGTPVPGILQARTLEWVVISFSNAWKWKVKGKSLSRVWLFATPWTAAHQAPPSMGFSRQEYWSGVPLPSPIFMCCGH